MKNPYIQTFTLILLFFTFSISVIYSQSRIDSLEAQLGITRDSKSRIDLLNHLSWELKESNPEKAIEYAEQAFELSKEYSYDSGIASSLYNQGHINYYQDKYPKALNFYERSLRIREKIGEKIASTCNSIGNIYYFQGNYSSALDYYYRSLKLFEEKGDKSGIAIAHINIGKIYSTQENFEEALKEYNSGLKINREINNKAGIVEAYNMITEVYRSQGNLEKALENVMESADVVVETGNQREIAGTYRNIGEIYLDLNQYEQAFEKLTYSQMISETINDYYGLAYTYRDFGSYHNAKGELEEATEYYKKAYNIVNKLGLPDVNKELLEGLSSIYAKKEDFKSAYIFHVLYKEMSDSLSNKENTKKITQMSMQYEFDKKEKLREAEARRQRNVRNFLIMGFLLVLVLAFVLLRSYKIKQKDNKLLAAQKAELQQQKEEIQTQAEQLEKTNNEIEKKNTQIMDSINYARRIQQAILISEDEILKVFPDSFIYFRPRDIVSGDFYWYSRINGKYIIAAIDCTGHGVPGAFMSMIGNTLLNEIVNQKKITEAGKILQELHIGVYIALQKEKASTESEDGMDMSLCVIDKQNRKVQFAGAKNEMYIFKNNELNTIRADFLSIGGRPLREDEEIKFNTVEVEVDDETSLYMLSDGYMDQFGGEKNEKFNIVRFENILKEHGSKSMQEQKTLFDDAITEWKKRTKQTDDILLIGLRPFV